MGSKDSILDVEYMLNICRKEGVFRPKPAGNQQTNKQTSSCPDVIHMEGNI